MSPYDVIVVGAGAAGAALAARLSDDQARRVLLVEAGRDCPTAEAFGPELLDAGVMAAAMPGHRDNWPFPTHLAPDVPYSVVRGRILGGSTTLNGAYFVRARAADFARWVAAGNAEWSYTASLPFYKHAETDLTYGETDIHGGSGPVPVYRERAHPHPVSEAFYAACAELGYPAEQDKNDQGEPGCGPLPVNAIDGTRINTGIAYVNPRRDRPNLSVRGNTPVRRVAFDRIHAVGVETEAGELIEAGEVVLCAGAIKSPHLLALSGIGPADELKAAGIPVVADLPGVGRDFTDHPAVMVTWHPGRGDARTRLLFEAALNLVGSDGTPLEVLPALRPLAAALGERDGSEEMFFTATVQEADARGTIRTLSPDSPVPPRIDYGYLATGADRRRVREAVRAAASVARTRAFGQVCSGLRGLDDGTLADDGLLDAWARAHLATAVHASGSCRMGPASDPMAVTDQYGRVRGVSGLRVADTSILPTVPSRGPAATAVMIGERVADMIRQP